MNTTRHVLTIKQVAEYLQVSTDTVYRLATSGELQGRKIGRIWRFPKDAIQEYLRSESRLRHGNSEPGGNKLGAIGCGDCKSASEQSGSIEPTGRVTLMKQSEKEASDGSYGL